MQVPKAAQVLDAHACILRRFGGERGVLHASLVHATLARCRHGPFVVGDLAERAAFLVRGIAQDHPFVDGNKRTAYAVADAFARRNGHRLAASPEEATAFMLEVARGDADLDAIAAWLRPRLEKVYAPPFEVVPDALEVLPPGAAGEPG